MAYTCQIVTKEGVRDFFNPRLTEEEYPDQQLLAKIKGMEYAVNDVYGVSFSSPTTNDVEAVTMLIAAKIGSEPRVVQKRVNLTRESWTTEKQASEGHDPYSIAEGWEQTAKKMLRSHLPNSRGYKIVNHA